MTDPPKKRGAGRPTSKKKSQTGPRSVLPSATPPRLTRGRLAVLLVAVAGLAVGAILTVLKPLQRIGSDTPEPLPPP
ncbi:MAG: hypothetical protein ABI877_19680, partial [Gemmatimonadaceae bacterium]